MDTNKIKTRLIEARGEKTLATVAKETGLTAQALCNYEAGLRIPRDEVKQILAKYYGTTVQELFYD